MSKQLVIHTQCKGVAYLCEDREYLANEPILSEYFFHLDGSKTEPYEKIVCGSCGMEVTLTIKDDGKLKAESAYYG